jgi:hypothetical protein
VGNKNFVIISEKMHNNKTQGGNEMIETFVFSSETIFLKKEDQTKIHQLLDYLKSRGQQIGVVFYDQATMNDVLLEQHLADYLDFSINNPSWPSRFPAGRAVPSKGQFHLKIAGAA